MHCKVLERDIQVVDTPGLFDTNTSPEIVQREIVKCIGMTAPGPHCFLLVLGLNRFTNEEEESVYQFFDFFGNNVFRYFIVVFTRKDDLDHDGKSLEDHLDTVPESLTEIIQKCGGRCIAFNNRAPNPDQQKQVKLLLDMIDDNVRNNNGTYYTNDMYIEAEKSMKRREHEILEERKNEKERERRQIKKELERKYTQDRKEIALAKQNVEIMQKNYEKINREKEKMLEKRMNELEYNFRHQVGKSRFVTSPYCFRSATSLR